MGFKRISHLNLTPIVDGYADLYVPPIVPDFTQIEVLTLTQKYNLRPDILAYELYGDAHFWWIFPLYNKNQILDPINDFKTGLVILVPTRNFIAGL
jgi:hypothetical protein